MASVRSDSRAPRKRSLLLLGVATAALLVGVDGALASGRTFDWTGLANGTSFANAANYGPGYNLDGSPAYDDEGVPIPGPPDGNDDMTVTQGTPTITSGGRHIHSLDLGGGQFIVRNSTNYGPSSFFIDGTLTLRDTGALKVGGDDRGPSVVTVDTMVMTGGTVSGVIGPGILAITNSLTQSGGDVSQLTIETPNYDLSGGTLDATVDFANTFSLSGTGTVESGAQLAGSGDASTMTQSGGAMNGGVTGIASYTHSGGDMGGSIVTGTYDLTGAAATSSGGTITASNLFALEPASGAATVGASLSGTGNLVKSGDSTVMLGGTNDFTGTVSINAGTLELQNGAALADTAAVTVANAAGATLLVTNSETIGSLAGGGATGGTVTIADGETLTTGDATDTTFMGTMGGEAGSLVKQGAGAFTLGGDVVLGALTVDDGRLNIGTGTSQNVVSFDSAVVGAGTTLYVASGATLTIRIPKNIINNGHLINDGTVYDDLANAMLFDNNHDYIADVASNTSTINNNTPGVWTGNVITNAGAINNNTGASWVGKVLANTGGINNSGSWTGDIEANSSYITNLAGGTWHGDIVDNVVNIANSGGTWTGDVKANSNGTIFNDGATAIWTGDVLTNNSQIVNKNGATWTGKVFGNNNVIFNMVGSNWNGDVVASGGGSNGLAQIDNYGTWTGAVETNAATIFNLAGSWAGNVLANAGMIINNANDVNTNAVGANQAAWTGDVTNTTGSIINDHAGIWEGKVLANNNGIFNESGASWTGEVVANGGGSNSHAQIDNFGSWAGAVDSNAGSIYNLGGSWTGAVLANAGTIVNNLADSETNVGGANQAVWIGGITSNSGRVINQANGTWTGAIAANAGTVTNRGTWDGNVLSNAGTIANEGIWNGDFASAGTVTAQNQINGAFDNAGLLRLTGSLTGITTLNNTGTLDLGGGGASDTLAAQSASFGSTSFYDVKIDAAGNSDLLQVSGNAALAGTVRISAAATVHPYGALSPYTILTAGSLGGAFGGVTTDLAFLAPRLSYDAHNVTLTVMRNDIGFADIGATDNQRAAGAAVQALGAGNALYDAVLWLNQGQAESAFDQLSGELWTSISGVSIIDAGVISNIASGRLDGAFDALGDREPAASAYVAGPAAGTGPRHRSGVWAQAYGARASVAGSGGTAGIDATTGGLVGGIDGVLGDWRVGVLLQAGTTGTSVAARNASGTSSDYGVGVYAGRQWGATRLSLGGAYTRHDQRTSRTVAFPGFTENLTASYASGTAQAFGKLSHDFDLGAISLIPYASLEYVHEATDAFAETGGAAALSSLGNIVDATFATLGLGANRKFSVGDGMLLTASGSLGWRHAFADAPTSTLAFAGGGSFTVVGAPIAADAVVLDAGLHLDVSDAVTLDVTYDGQLAQNSQTHALKATWSTRF